MKLPLARILKRSIAVALTLGLFGYFLGQGLIMSHKAFAGSAYDPENERVLWQTPLVMGLLGLLLTAGMEILVEMVRRPGQLAKAAQAQATAPTTSPIA